MLQPLINRLLAGSQPPVGKTQASLPNTSIARIETRTGAAAKKNHNPFLSALNSESQEFQEQYGVNRPLGKPMFLGYRDNQALYGGARLFILY